MTIRKTGSATGQVTGIDRPADERLLKSAAGDPDASHPGWHPLDDDMLDAENQMADADGQEHN